MKDRIWVIYDSMRFPKKNCIIDICGFNDFESVLARYRFFHEMFPGYVLGCTTLERFDDLKCRYKK